MAFKLPWKSVSVMIAVMITDDPHDGTVEMGGIMDNRDNESQRDRDGAGTNRELGFSKPAPRARGFAAMGESEQREIARKGGQAVSQDRAHMSAIGRKGGEASHSNRGGSGRSNTDTLDGFGSNDR
jgi:general stress protein YciG